jgi:hypothetical protein
MDKNERSKREVAKTSEGHLRTKLEQEFEFAPRIAQAIVEEAQATLSSGPDEVGVGQTRVYLVRGDAGHGRALRATPTQPVCWTVDAGAEDQEVLAKHGRVALRQVRIQRLLSEATEQGALASQEDLARVLHVAVRTIKRDCKTLQEEGIWLPLRGTMCGIGRGQSHKALIIRRWLQGETYDQLERSTKHSVVSIRRYIQTFLRVMELHQAGFASSEVAHLTQCGMALIDEYLAVYQACDDAVSRSRLAEQLDRVQRPTAKKRRNL